MMRGAILPGNRTVEFREIPVPQPQHGQVLVKMKVKAVFHQSRSAPAASPRPPGAEG